MVRLQSLGHSHHRRLLRALGIRTIGLGVDGDGANAQGSAGAEYPSGDLPAVGDEDALEHAQAGWDCSILTRSTAPTRQPLSPCSQRALSVTAPPGPLNRYLMMRWRPSLAKAAT